MIAMPAPIAIDCHIGACGTSWLVKASARKKGDHITAPPTPRAELRARSPSRDGSRAARRQPGAENRHRAHVEHRSQRMGAVLRPVLRGLVAETAQVAAQALDSGARLHCCPQHQHRGQESAENLRLRETGFQRGCRALRPRHRGGDGDRKQKEDANVRAGPRQGQQDVGSQAGRAQAGEDRRGMQDPADLRDPNDAQEQRRDRGETRRRMHAQECIPHLRMVRCSMVRKMKFSTSSPMMMTVKRPAEHRRDVEQVLVLVDEPAQAAVSRRRSEHQFGRDERAPCEGPADLEAREDVRERRGNQDLAHEAHAGQAVVASYHAHACSTRPGTRSAC